MKKMFKKSNIFSFILGAIIFGGIVGVSAYSILASDIGYTPSNSTWKKADGSDITNVKDAIDELYEISGNNCVNKTIDYTGSNAVDGWIKLDDVTFSPHFMAVRFYYLDGRLFMFYNYNSENIYVVTDKRQNDVYNYSNWFKMQDGNLYMKASATKANTSITYVACSNSF